MITLKNRVTLFHTSLIILSLTLGTSALAQKDYSYSDDVMKYPKKSVLNFADGSYAGKSMLYTQREIIKPALDAFARDGFIVADNQTVVKALKLVAPKVRKKILAKHTEAQLATIAEELRSQGPISFLDMPNRIAKIDSKADRFNLPTYLALVSGGGVALRFAKGDYAYNVNYAIGKPRGGQEKAGYDAKAVQTGRSFGMGVGKRHGEVGKPGPNDVSDKTHLDGLQEMVQDDMNEGLEMTRTIIQATGNSDFSNFKNMSKLNQTLTSDYFAVYTAEQVRNLMDRSLKTQSWDVSLMEVTLLSLYYAKQKEIWIMYQDKFHGIDNTYTNEVYDQYPVGKPTKTKDGDLLVTWKLRDAAFYDYWQRSFRFKPESKDLRETRSGINITRPQFRIMGKLITGWVAKNKPSVVENVAEILGSRGENLYEELSSFFINEDAPESHPETNELAEAFVEFQRVVAENGPKIHETIKRKFPKPELTKKIVTSKLNRGPIEETGDEEEEGHEFVEN